jgi:hypothetical protein
MPRYDSFKTCSHLGRSILPMKRANQGQGDMTVKKRTFVPNFALDPRVKRSDIGQLYKRSMRPKDPTQIHAAHSLPCKSCCSSRKEFWYQGPNHRLIP